MAVNASQSTRQAEPVLYRLVDILHRAIALLDRAESLAEQRSLEMT
jgi:hypothetical protein